MLKPKRILLASHGTEGARAAEKMAFSLCQKQTALHHLVVVPDFWKGMMGDDWLNNASTRDTFGNYVEGQLDDEIRSHVKKLIRETEKRGINYQYQVELGKPTECLIKAAHSIKPDLVIIGAPRPRGKTGYRSRMKPEQLVHKLNATLLIVPHP